jgi:hypothetical protein
MRSTSATHRASTSIAALAALIGTAIGACVWNDGNPQIVAPRIDGNLVSAPPLPAPPIAWSATFAGSPSDVDTLDQLRARAQARRSVSPALREAEDTACAGLSDDDRDVSPFFYRRDILDVVPLRAAGREVPGRIVGAVVTFRRIEGLTAERLQRLVDCHAARAAALAYAAPETQWCPLAVRGVAASVAVSERGLDVRLTASDPNAAVETYARAQALRAAESSGGS